MKSIRLSKMSAIYLCFALASGSSVYMAQEPPGKVSNVLVGRIFSENGTTPIPDAVVKAYHMESGRIFSSNPSRETGSYTLTGLPNGSYDIVVESSLGSFLSEDIVELKGGVRVLMSFTLSEQSLPTTADRRLELQGMDREEAKGLAKVLRKREGEPFWSKGGGVASIVLGSIAAGVVVEEIFDEDEASPTTP